MRKGLIIFPIFLLLIQSSLAGHAGPPKKVLIRQDRFFGGPYSIVNHPYLIRGQVAYIGQDLFQSAFMHYQVGEGEIETTFFDEIGLNPHIPFFYQAESSWIPEELGAHTLKVWFTGLNGAPVEEGFSDTLTRQVVIYEFLPSRQIALLESFSSINCGSCALVAPDLLEIIDNNPEQYAMIYYHPIAYEGSPLYGFNPKDQTTRKELYGVNYTPVSAIGSTFFGGSFEVSPELMALEWEKFSAFTLEGNYYIENEVLHASVSIESFASFSENSTNTLLLALTEDLVQFDTPPGSNGEKDFHHVMRSFLPDAHGTPLSGMAEGEPQTFSFEYDLGAGVINTSGFTLLAFVQDLESHEIHQLIRLNYQPQDNSMISEFQNLEGNVFPNPGEGRMLLTLANTSKPAVVRIFGLDGQLVFLENYPAGQQSLSIEADYLQEGIYILQATSGQAIFREKISIIRQH